MRKFDIRSLLVVAIVAAFSSSLLGCPDKAAPDPATATKDAGTAAAAAPGASAAAPAKSGGW
jgi:hypothetical protein